MEELVEVGRTYYSFDGAVVLADAFGLDGATLQRLEDPLFIARNAVRFCTNNRRGAQCDSNADGHQYESASAAMLHWRRAERFPREHEAETEFSKILVYAQTWRCKSTLN